MQSVHFNTRLAANDKADTLDPPPSPTLLPLNSAQTSQDIAANEAIATQQPGAATTTTKERGTTIKMK